MTALQVKVHYPSKLSATDSSPNPNPSPAAAAAYAFAPAPSCTEAVLAKPLHSSKDNDAARLWNLRATALVCLILQNSLLSICMRYSRTMHTESDRYISSTAVVMSEFIKLVCAAAMMLKESDFRVRAWKQEIYKCLMDEPIIILKLLVPSVLYTFQNNLQYVAISNLHPAMFQVLYQMKLLTTAGISYFLLNKRFSGQQWTSLFVLVAGISVVQLYQDQSTDRSTSESNVMGLIAVTLACCTSGFAGVYFEKVLKSSKASIWARNVQLALLGVVIAVSGVYGYDRQQILEKGFFHGYTPLVWFVICLQAIGGLIVAVVVKYADNVCKGLATSLSIVLSAVASMFMFDFEPTTGFALGAFLVGGAVFWYGQAPSINNKTLDPVKYDKVLECHKMEAGIKAEAA